MRCQTIYLARLRCERVGRVVSLLHLIFCLMESSGFPLMYCRGYLDQLIRQNDRIIVTYLPVRFPFGNQALLDLRHRKGGCE
jgi:hypothetical protein